MTRSIRSRRATANRRNSTRGDGSGSTASPISWCRSGATSTARWRSILRNSRDEQTSPKGLARHAALVHRRRIELVLDALEMIEPLNGAVEFRTFFLGKLGFHVGNLVGELGPIQILHRGGDVRQHRQALV